ncbi:hypothetical protein GHT06_010811 [Daphnia sinensis]|uniref:Uncharacterized protein n=1 Tax=Daphnia sinensis TaxID=1820382 RepID=A0AAD5LIH2_9CRUS|nr:hypothetical protein GHT06_010811 [Daphnia sinensis]
MNAGVLCLSIVNTGRQYCQGRRHTAHNIVVGYTCREHLINSTEHCKGLLNVGMLPRLDCTK